MLLRIAKFLVGIVWVHGMATVLLKITAMTNEAPTCVRGRAVGEPHLIVGYEQRSIDQESGFTVTMQSQSFGTRAVVVGQIVHVPLGEDILVTVRNVRTPFKGIMTRIDGGDAEVDASTVITLIENETQLKPVAICDSDVSALFLQ